MPPSVLPLPDCYAHPGSDLTGVSTPDTDPRRPTIRPGLTAAASSDQ